MMKDFLHFLLVALKPAYASICCCVFLLFKHRVLAINSQSFVDKETNVENYEYQANVFYR